MSPAFSCHHHLESAAKGYTKIVNLELDGIQPVNRSAHIGAKSRRVKKIMAKSSWFKKKKNQNQTQSNGHPSQKTARQTPDNGQPETILFVPFTRGSTLKKQMQKIDDQVQMGPNSERSKLLRN